MVVMKSLRTMPASRKDCRYDSYFRHKAEITQPTDKAIYPGSMIPLSAAGETDPPYLYLYSRAQKLSIIIHF